MTKKLYFKIFFGHENGRYTQERLNLKCESVWKKNWWSDMLCALIPSFYCPLDFFVRWHLKLSVSWSWESTFRSLYWICNVPPHSLFIIIIIIIIIVIIYWWNFSKKKRKIKNLRTWKKKRKKKVLFLRFSVSWNEFFLTNFFAIFLQFGSSVW